MKKGGGTWLVVCPCLLYVKASVYSVVDKVYSIETSTLHAISYKQEKGLHVAGLGSRGVGTYSDGVEIPTCDLMCMAILIRHEDITIGCHAGLDYRGRPIPFLDDALGHGVRHS